MILQRLRLEVFVIDLTRFGKLGFVNVKVRIQIPASSSGFLQVDR